MCILLISKNPSPEYSLIVIANRDEYRSRPTASLCFWPEDLDILGGRDLEGGGSWLAVSKTGRLAAITNISSGETAADDTTSRGLIVKEFLASTTSSIEYAKSLRSCHRRFNGFNLIVYDTKLLYWDSNRVDNGMELENGTYTISNAPLNTKWLKTEELERMFRKVIEKPSTRLLGNLLHILGPESSARKGTAFDNSSSEDRLKRNIFIQGTAYGTRCSSVIILKRDGSLAFTEKRYNAEGTSVGEDTIRMNVD